MGIQKRALIWRTAHIAFALGFGECGSLTLRQHCFEMVMVMLRKADAASLAMEVVIEVVDDSSW